jgi:RNA polymerase sigma-70 factor (ECF subfamily)
LIRDYVDNKSPQAFESLVRRHYNTVHKRLLRLTQNSADADDLSQKLWLRVLENISTYNDSQKFPHFLNTIASNLVKDEWRKSAIRKQSSLDQMLEETGGQVLLLDEREVSDQLYDQREIKYLVKTLIPGLSVKLRAVFLLRHESEYWDNKQPFQWQHLGELNKLSIEEAGRRFISARDTLIRQADNNIKASSEKTSDEISLDDENRLLFLTWTQAQRQDKSDTQTETYLASLLDIPVNTFKTRYRSALAELTSGLDKWRNQVNAKS